MHGNFNLVAIASDRFVHRVVNNLPDTVVQAIGHGVTDVHARAFTHGFQAFELFNHGSAVLAVCLGVAGVFNLVSVCGGTHAFSPV